MTREKVKVMLDAMAARQVAGREAAVSVIPTSGAPAQLEEKAITSATMEWASAWKRRDIPGYLAAYSPAMNGNVSWVTARRAMIGKAKEIKVVISAQKLDVRDTTHASMNFHQSYLSPDYSDEVDKVLEWELIGGRWLIVKETAVKAPAASGNSESKQPTGTSASMPATPRLTTPQR